MMAFKCLYDYANLFLETSLQWRTALLLIFCYLTLESESAQCV